MLVFWDSKQLKKAIGNTTGQKRLEKDKSDAKKNSPCRKKGLPRYRKKAGNLAGIAGESPKGVVFSRRRREGEHKSPGTQYKGNVRQTIRLAAKGMG